MAFSGVATLGNSQSKAADQNNIVLIVSASASVGQLVIVEVAVDNNGSSNGDFGAVSSVTDTVGNIYTKAVEFQNAGGATQGGVVVSIWYSVITIALTSGNDIITANFTTNTSRDAQCIQCLKVSIGAGKTVSVAGTATEAIATNPGSLDVTTENLEHFRLRVIGIESSTSTALTGTASWTVQAGTQTTGGSTNTNIGIRTEYRIVTGTSSASDPNTSYNVDMASAYVAFKEIDPPTIKKFGLLGVG